MIHTNPTRQMPSEHSLRRAADRLGGTPTLDSIIAEAFRHKDEQFARYKAGEFRGAAAYGSGKIKPLELSDAQRGLSGINLPARLDRIAAGRVA